MTTLTNDTTEAVVGGELHMVDPLESSLDRTSASMVERDVAAGCTPVGWERLKNDLQTLRVKATAVSQVLALDCACRHNTRDKMERVATSLELT
jgi:hypothetical protein